MKTPLPRIQFPVRGELSRYCIKLAADKDSTDFKYMLIGVWYPESQVREITIYNIAITAANPEYITVVYSFNDAPQKDGDTELRATFANEIKEIGTSLGVLKASNDDNWYALHHGSVMFLRAKDVKTFTFKAVGLSRTIRGNAHYVVYEAKRTDDNRISFTVANESSPDSKFNIFANGLERGHWHSVPGVLCPVPGRAPDKLRHPNNG